MTKNNHVILDISYSNDWLLCVCGWEGKALNRDYFNHRKEAPPLNVIFESPYTGKFMRTIKPEEMKELVLTK